MKSTVINSSKEMSAYSDFPPKPEAANYMHNQKLLEYFQDYAQHYKLHKHIKFNHKVTNIRKASDYLTSGRWFVDYTDSTGAAQSDTFDAVLLCIGHHKVPHWPEKWPGQDEFKGRILHSHDYKEPTGFDDKRVVAVGIGNSGADIAVELSRVAEKSRRFIYNVMYSIPRSIRAWQVQRTINNRFDHAAYGLQPKHDVFGAHTTQNDELPIRLASGTIVVKPNIDRFTEHDVYFTDGSKAENIDYVVLSTGYDITFPIVEGGELIKVDNNRVELYKYMYPLDQPHNTFAVIGLIQVDYIPFMDELATIIGCRPRFLPLLFQDTALAIATTFGPCAPYIYRINGPHKWEVDVYRAIFHPRTFEDSLCIYVVATFLGGWITMLTFVFSYWLYFRVPIPQYTYELVTGGCVQVTPGKDSVSEEVDRGGGGSPHRSSEPTQASKEKSNISRELFGYAEQATQAPSLVETPTQMDEIELQ
ncbi:hypothetical protein Y032_0154g3001 [Ancylostoma ceylanicum]|uniref:Flavin-containing monooxygenase n=1 Tax=Ancylostoma ceylanicum TaxID=53326 RepID=A0A016T0F7_9BILA|nr:hypothetical protein Y032_0154g3001 [Ancylostoma ceylanicum]